MYDRFDIVKAFGAAPKRLDRERHEDVDERVDILAGDITDCIVVLWIYFNSVELPDCATVLMQRIPTPNFGDRG